MGAAAIVSSFKTTVARTGKEATMEAKLVNQLILVVILFRIGEQLIIQSSKRLCTFFLLVKLPFGELSINQDFHLSNDGERW